MGAREPDVIEVENAAWLGRVTCGWKKPELDLAVVRPFWRDAHSPAIARRAGVYEYRHYPLDPVRADLFAPLAGVDQAGEPDEMLMWLSDVRYANEAGLKAFGASPPPYELGRMLNDIEMIVDKSTTYRVEGDKGRTLIDTTGDPAPQGDAPMPVFAVFFRAAADEASFRQTLVALAERWAATPGVKRLRLNLFEVPDMEAERKAGYPVKTHPIEMQYQAWIDLWLEDEAVAGRLLSPDDAADLSKTIKAIHAYPAPAVYTFNYNGRPTLSGLRGYMGAKAIWSLNAQHHEDPALLEWMYGPIAKGGASR